MLASQSAMSAEQSDRFRNALYRVWRFVRLVAAKFMAHKAPENAAALTYTTLLSLVPLMTVSLAFFAALPIGERVGEVIQDFVFNNFVPAAGEVVRQHLEEFANKASGVSGIGFGFLVVTTLMMMSNVDRSLNAIWEVKRQRSPLSKFLVYWTVITLGPVLIGLSVVATSYLLSLPLLSEAATSGFGRQVLGLTPVLASTLAFTLTYALVPNRKVSLKHALIGGLLAAVLFELAKRGFGFYVTRFPSYQAIYGALAAVPIFLVWVYLSWIVTLLGAEFTHCLGIFRHYEARHGGQRDQVGLVEAVGVMLGLAKAQKAGQSISTAQLVESLPEYSDHCVELTLQDLATNNWVCATADNAWVLTRDADSISLYELIKKQHYAMPPTDWVQNCPRLAEKLADADGELAQTLATPLTELAEAGETQA